MSVAFGIVLYLLIGIMVDSLSKVFFLDTPDDDIPGIVAFFWPVCVFVFLFWALTVSVSKVGDMISESIISLHTKWRINARDKG